jgi:hypothetical protein
MCHLVCLYQCLARKVQLCLRLDLVPFLSLQSRLSRNLVLLFSFQVLLHLGIVLPEFFDPLGYEGISFSSCGQQGCLFLERLRLGRVGPYEAVIGRFQDLSLFIKGDSFFPSKWLRPACAWRSPFLGLISRFAVPVARLRGVPSRSVRCQLRLMVRCSRMQMSTLSDLLCFGSCTLLGYVSRGVQRLVCRSLMLMFRSARPVCLLSLADCDPGYVQSPPRRAGCGGTLWEISRVWYLRLVESHFWDDVPQKRGKHAERDCARMLEQSRFPVPGVGHVLGLESFCPHSNLNR